MASDQIWKSLASAPFNNSGFIKSVIKLSSSQFAVISGEFMQSYDIKTNTWTLFNHLQCSLACKYITSNLQTQRIIITGYDSTHRKLMINTINIKDNTQRTYESDIPLTECAGIISVNSDVHIFTLEAKHYIWNMDTCKSQFVHQFDEYSGGLSSFGLVYVASKQDLLLLGGFERISHDRIDDIHRYCLLTGKWTKLCVKLPYKMNHFGCVITKEQRYISVLGGITGMATDDIFVFDSTRMETNKSKIKLPFKGLNKAIITRFERLDMSICT